MMMSGSTPTPSELNEIHRAFWEIENAKRDRRIADPALWEAALEELHRDQLRGVGPRDQETIEFLLEKYERFQRNVIVGHARRAGQASKTDALQQHIAALVSNEPRITAPQLLARLEQEVHGELIQEIVEGMLCFTQPDGTEEARTKKAPVSGLKDRLSRAKKHVNSR